MPQVSVFPTRGDQLVVRANLADSTIRHHSNTICIMCGVQPVRNRHNGTALKDRVQGLLQITSRTRIKQTGGLVENQRMWIQQNQPGKRNLLSLRRSECVST
jgi:hypothetical protein